MKRILKGVLIAGTLVNGAAAAHAADNTAFLISTATAATSYSAALATINAGFFNQASAFVSSPDNPKPDQTGGGPWVRGSTGSFNVNATGQATGAGVTIPTSVKNFSDYSGIQGGFDIGRYNFGGSGYSLNFGVTGGEIDIDTKSTVLSASFNVPFVGLYASFAGHGFFADALVRHDFFDARITDAALGLVKSETGLSSTTFAASGGYHYDVLKMFFVEPSVGLSISGLSNDKIPINTIPTAPGLTGVFQQNALSSDLVRFNVRVGKDFVYNNFIFQPFVTASVWNEFGNNTGASFAPTSAGAFPATASSTRVGTFEQYSIGVNAKLTGTNMLAFVRGDLRAGDNVHGTAFTGGLRYQF